MYTGAAMASIAAGECVAVVDANVMRILARLRCLDWELKSVKQYSTLAQTLVDPKRPGDFNQVTPFPPPPSSLVIHQLLFVASSRVLHHGGGRVLHHGGG
jgi:hypothetical protein